MELNLIEPYERGEIEPITTPVELSKWLAEHNKDPLAKGLRAFFNYLNFYEIGGQNWDSWLNKVWVPSSKPREVHLTDKEVYEGYVATYTTMREQGYSIKVSADI
ncbi:MAG: hypothetical protein PWR26_751 [Methanosarcinales archaeon]|uniref:hypothetical protein n=1 Tax=Methermicoccus shengliensis TaxID=660064 RepID=UPI0005B265F8|nr:hypothetical protein [Methermicoccus shengliensis]MDI3488034.1 hypothetical protein [Methanosarcinales archaeon]MDN5295655.1 hypothetical protein [Methanosarcinales archaeon]